MIDMISKGELNRLGWFHIDDIKAKINKIKSQDTEIHNCCHTELYLIDRGIEYAKKEILELLKKESEDK